MSRVKAAPEESHQVHGVGTEALELAQAEQAGAMFEWHYGRITRLGHFEVAGGPEVSVVWEEGGVTSQQGGLADEQWDIFKLAFLTTGRIAVLSDQEGDKWNV
jgi:hypothetical protein